MHRRSLSRGRRIALLGALVVAAGCLLPWYAIGGGTTGLPARDVSALRDLTGLLVFLAGLAVLALVVLPYAAGDRPVTIDRWPAYALLLLVAAAGIVVTVLSILQQGPVLDGFRPDRAPGIWISALGVVVLGRGVFQIWEEPGA